MPHYTVPEIRELISAGRRRIVFLVNRHAFSLEYFGPLQVFAEANWMLERSGRSEGYELEVVATEPGTVYDVCGLEVLARRTYLELEGDVDTLMIQAVDEQEEILRDERLLAWVRDMSRRVRRIASVCVGTYILAEAGVLDGRRATTHWAALRDFRRRFPQIHLESDPIYVKDDNVYTSAGGTYGFDLALAMVEEDYGRELARRVAQGLVVYMKVEGAVAVAIDQLDDAPRRLLALGDEGEARHLEHEGPPALVELHVDRIEDQGLGGGELERELRVQPDLPELRLRRLAVRSGGRRRAGEGTAGEREREDALKGPRKNSSSLWPPIHPAWLRCSSLTYSRGRCRLGHRRDVLSRRSSAGSARRRGPPRGSRAPAGSRRALRGAPR